MNEQIKTGKFRFLGLNLNNTTMSESMSIIDEFIDSGRPHMIFTPTAELIVKANKDADLRNIYNKTDMLTIDSYVVFYSARLFGKKFREPVSAARIMLNYLKIADLKRRRIYLLGATEEVVNQTVQNIKKYFPNINIVGYHNGYFDFSNDSEIVADIKQKSPDILFVALSSPLKEHFINRNFIKMNVPVSIGVGGTFDIIAGKCKLAPEWISIIGFEWFYRFLQEPRRLFKRYMLTNIQYLVLLIRELFKTNN